MNIICNYIKNDDFRPGITNHKNEGVDKNLKCDIKLKVATTAIIYCSRTKRLYITFVSVVEVTAGI